MYDRISWPYYLYVLLKFPLGFHLEYIFRITGTVLSYLSLRFFSIFSRAVILFRNVVLFRREG